MSPDDTASKVLHVRFGTVLHVRRYRSTGPICRSHKSLDRTVLKLGLMLGVGSGLGLGLDLGLGLGLEFRVRDRLWQTLGLGLW